jgi:carboxylesterase type B
MVPLEAHLTSLGLIDRSTDHIFSRRPENELESETGCLNLNIMTPSWPVVESVKEGLPVVLWIHGGSFRQGDANHPTYTDSPLPHREGLILVTVNYRLGVLGFMGGNYGLYDLKLALEFVREHITSFGGNPDRITLWGESAGAILGSYLLRDATVQLDAAILFSGALGSTVPKDSGVWERMVESCRGDVILASPVLKPEKLVAEPLPMEGFAEDDAKTLFTPSPALMPVRVAEDAVGFMKSLSVTTLLEHQARIEAQGGVSFGLQFDGELVSRSRAEKAGTVNRLAIALVKDEGTMFGEPQSFLLIVRKLTPASKVPDLPLSNPHILNAALATIIPNADLQSHAVALYNFDSITSESNARSKAAELIADMVFYAPVVHSIRAFDPRQVRKLMLQRPFRFSPFAETWGCHHSSLLPFAFTADAMLTESERVLAKEIGHWIGGIVRREEDPAGDGCWSVADAAVEAKAEDEVIDAERMGRIEFWMKVAEEMGL